MRDFGCELFPCCPFRIFIELNLFLPPGRSGKIIFRRKTVWSAKTSYSCGFELICKNISIRYYLIFHCKLCTFSIAILSWIVRSLVFLTFFKKNLKKNLWNKCISQYFRLWLREPFFRFPLHVKILRSYN